MTDLATRPRHARAPARRSRRSTGFRPEVQALRALAVSLVVVFHVWPDALPGGYVGVDVFFVISGFLITGHLLREIEADGSVRLGRFWARRVRRLLPSAMLVLAVTTVAAVVVLPATMWRRTVTEVAASATYVENWLLAASSVDYFAAERSATAVQHYWSLSVEEQFYLVWPVLLVLVALLARRRGAGVRRALLLALAAVAAGSFAFSVWYSSTSPAPAYFSTFTHAWEFAAGALLAAGGPLLVRAPGVVRGLATTVGLGAIIGSALALDGSTAFPGWVALVPVTGTLLVVAAERGDLALLRTRGVQALGTLSYTVYLWHWPLVVLVPFVLAHDVDLVVGVGIVGTTLGLAALTTWLVEDPVRRSRFLAARPNLAFLGAGAGALALVLAAVLVTGVGDQRIAQASAAADRRLADASGTSCLGAAAVLSGSDCPSSHVPDADLLLADAAPVPLGGATVAALDGGGLHDLAHELTDPRSGDDADLTVALVGDSHAGVFLPTLQELSRLHGWRVWSVQHNNCTPSAPTWVSPVDVDMWDSCQGFRRALLDELPASGQVDVVVVSSVAPRYAALMPDDELGPVVDAFETTFRAWTDAGIPVVVIADVPGPGPEVGEAAECVAARPDVVDPCTSPRAEVLERDPMAEAARRIGTEAGVTLVDWTPVYCDEDVCHAVVGGLVVYDGGAHLSDRFARTLAPYLDAAVTAAVGR